MNQKSIDVSVHTLIMPYCQLLVILNIVFPKFIMPGIQNICHGDGAPPYIFTYVTWYIYLLNFYLLFILIRNVYIHLLSIWTFISSTKLHIEITLNPFRNMSYTSKVHLLKIYIFSHMYKQSILLWQTIAVPLYKQSSFAFLYCHRKPIIPTYNYRESYIRNMNIFDMYPLQYIIFFSTNI